MKPLTVVVPCYNEARRLDTRRFRAFIEREPAIEFLFVNDGSTDDTVRVLDGVCAAAPSRASVMSLERNSGKAEAVRQGMLEALERGARTVAFWDADLATPLEAICDFRAILERRTEIGIVMGSRVQLLGRLIQRKPSRHYLGRAFATTVSLMLGVRVYDTQCGAKMFRASPELRTVLADPFHSRWIFDVEILARLLASRRPLGLPPLERYIYELPLMEWRDVGDSKVKPRDFMVAVPELARIWWTYIRKSAPARDEAALRTPTHASSTR